MRSLIIGIDPSTVATGVALFVDEVLVKAWVVEARGLDNMLDAVKRFFRADTVEGVAWHLAEAVVEHPEVWGKGDPADLIQVAQVTGACRTFFPYNEAVAAGRWTRGVPYQIRERRIGATLLEAERAHLTAIRRATRHNAVDAVGIGLWKIGRQYNPR